MKLSLRHFFRSRRTSLTATVVVVLCTGFLLLFSDSITTYRTELHDSYQLLEVSARIVSADPAGKPRLSADTCRTIITTGFPTEYSLMSDHSISDFRLLRGLNNVKIDPALRDCIEDVAWNEGYDASIFQGNEMVCLLPNTLYAEKNTTWECTVGANTYSFAIAGTYGNRFTDLDSISVYYCPVKTLEDIYQKESLAFSYCGFEMELQNLAELDTFKAQLKDLGMDTGLTRMVINDSQLQSVTAQLRRQIRLLETLLPVLLGLIAGISFGLSFLLLRGRKREAAILRSLGMRRRSVFAALEGEIALQALLGLLIGAGIGFATLGVQALQPKYMAALLICYLLGGGFAAWKISGINVFNIMTARE